MRLIRLSSSAPRRRAPAGPIITVLAIMATAAASSSPMYAQAGGPLALLVPVSARAASLGNAWVAGRDEYTIFSNPALITPTTGFGLTLASHGSDGRSIASASAATVGEYTFGWGVHLLDFSTSRSNTAYPYAPAALVGSGDADLFSMVAVVAVRRTYKGFGIGVAAKYAQDVVPRETAQNGLLVVPTRGAALLGDVGISHSLLGGTAGLSVQNISQPYSVGPNSFSVPTQIAVGWSDQTQWGPLDIGYVTQVTARREGWVAPGGGVEVGWAWIDGYSVTGRVGARRTETDDEKPVGIGASFRADRLNIEYGVNFYTGNEASHRLTLRWR